MVQPVRPSATAALVTAVSMAKPEQIRYSFPSISMQESTCSITFSRPRSGSPSIQGHRSSSRPCRASPSRGRVSPRMSGTCPLANSAYIRVSAP